MAELLTDSERRFYESQTELAKKQGEILDRQDKFNKILALATAVLAIGTFLQIIFVIMNGEIDFSSLTRFPIIFALIFVIGLIFLITLMGVIVVAVARSILKKENKK